ncbi:hypothetical protein M1555_02760 [Patescibacteria group bacterium]|nr:hypothetical protein [Patescibacteria group bacterium]
MIPKKTALLFAVFCAGIAVDVLTFRPAATYDDFSGDLRLVLFLALWLSAMRVFHSTSLMTFRLVFLLIAALSALSLFAPGGPAIGRVASWIYVFAAAGVAEQLIELRNPA